MNCIASPVDFISILFTLGNFSNEKTGILIAYPLLTVRNQNPLFFSEHNFGGILHMALDKLWQ